MFANINYPAVLVAAVAAFIVGAIWYSPPVFGKKWSALVKRYAHLTDEQLGGSPVRPLFFWFLTALVNAFVLAIFVTRLGMHSPQQAFLLSGVTWLGFGATFSAWPVIFAKQPISIWMLNNTAFFLMQFVMALVLVLWR